MDKPMSSIKRFVAAAKRRIRGQMGKKAHFGSGGAPSAVFYRRSPSFDSIAKKLATIRQKFATFSWYDHVAESGTA
jgi:hypothetical protein